MRDTSGQRRSGDGTALLAAMKRKTNKSGMIVIQVPLRPKPRIKPLKVAVDPCDWKARNDDACIGVGNKHMHRRVDAGLDLEKEKQ